MEWEPSGLGVVAIGKVRQTSYELNSVVHAGQVARYGAVRPPHDDISESALRRFGSLQRSVFSNCCIALAAYNRPKFDRLKAAERAHFDWLVGSTVRKRVRQGPFGLPKL